MPVIDLRQLDCVIIGGQESRRLYLGSTLIYDLPSRISVERDEPLTISGNSLTATMVGLPPEAYHGGELAANWTGAIAFNFAGGSLMRQRWDADGADRAAISAGAVIVQEYWVPENGEEIFADPTSEPGVDALQVLYWYAMLAQAQGAKMFCIYPGWANSTSAVTANMDLQRIAEYWRQWLQARPELKVPVYIIPSQFFVPQAEAIHLAAEPGNPTRYEDGIHLQSTQIVDNALSWFVEMFLLARPLPGDPERTAIEQELVDLGWAILRQYECTGLGTEVVAPWPVAFDPLPNPQPLPRRPYRPAAPLISSITATTASAAWTAPEDGGSPITGFDLTVYPADPGSPVIHADVTSPYALTGLAAETGFRAYVEAINARGRSDPGHLASFATPAVSSGPTLLSELTPTGHTGPAPSSGSFPAAVDGYRTFTPGDPAPVVLPIALSGSVYAVMAVRKSMFTGSSIAVMSFNDGGYGDWPLYAINATGHYGDFSNSLGLSVGAESTAGLGLTGAWAVIEGFVDGGSIARICANGGTDEASGSAGAGSLITTNAYICRNEGSTGQVVDIAAWRIYDDVPADRAAERDWVRGQAPEGAFPPP